MRSPTEFRALVAKDDVSAGAGCGKGCRDAGQTATDDQHVAMGEAAGVMIGRLPSARSEAGSGPMKGS